MAPLQFSSLQFNEKYDLKSTTKFRRRILMKRRARLERSINRPRNAIERKVRILKKLINPNSEFMGVERLFRETADYIVALEMRVKVMQIMVNVLSGSSDDEHK